MKGKKMQEIALDKRAYVGPPKGVRPSPMARQDLEERQPERHWSYKNKKVRRQEIIDSL